LLVDNAWLAIPKAQRPDPHPRNDEPGTSQLAEWLAAERGYQEVAKAHNTKLEYEPSTNDYLTPPEFHAELDREFNFTRGFDPCPYPRPKGFDGLKGPWPESTYCNSPFRKQDGIGIAAFARKAIEENKLGKTVVLVLPTFGTINCLLEAGAELRSARRINWIDPKTGKPATTSPSSNMLAILRGTAHWKENEIAVLKARITELEAENAALKVRTDELQSDTLRSLRRENGS
jgi:hypothetical protein